MSSRSGAEDTSHEVQTRHRAFLGGSDVEVVESNHRIANSLGLAASLLRRQRARSNDPAVKGAILTAEARLASIAKFHSFVQRHDLSGQVNLAEYLLEVLPQIGSGIGIRCVLAVRACSAVEVPPHLARQLTIIINELALNALKHGYDGRPGGCVTVQVEKDSETMLRIEVADGGPGLPNGFDLKTHGGFGLEIVSLLVRELQGTLKCHTDGGACFTMLIPAY